MDDSNFDFENLSQEEEKLDFNRLLPCPNCKKPIPLEATMCLYCGGSVIRHAKPKWIVFTAVFLVIIFILFIIFVF